MAGDISWEESVLLYSFGKLPEDEQIIVPEEIGLPPWDRVKTHTYLLDLPDALAFELAQQRW
jgi:hypothetical protein